MIKRIVSLSWLGLSLLFLALVANRLRSWPYRGAWEIGIFVTEWANWVVLLAALIFLVGLRLHKGSALVAFLAGAILFDPLLAAYLTQPGFSSSALFAGLAQHRPPDQTVNYANAPEALMDIYLPRGKGHKAPVVLVVHGGSWCRGSRLEFTELNNYLQERGYAVATIDYRLAPAHPFPAALLDLEAAQGYLIEHAQQLDLDPERITWLGRSAGAHLALLAAYRHTHPARGVIAFYPPTDLTWSYENPSNPYVLDSCAAIRDFMGGSPVEQPQAYADSSPLLASSPQSPPTLLLHGLVDNLVYPEQTRRLDRRLEVLGVPHETILIPWANHGFDIKLSGPSGQISTAAVVQFLERVNL